MEVTKHRSIFISDVHIGIRASKVKELLHFLKYNDCDHLYLLGDIIDGWRLKKNWFWNPDFNTFIQKVLRKNSLMLSKVLLVIKNYNLNYNKLL